MFSTRKKVADKKERIRVLMVEMENAKKDRDNHEIARKKLEMLRAQKSGKLVETDVHIDQEFEDALADEIAEFEDKRNLKEFMKFEQTVLEETKRRKTDEERVRKEEKIADERKKHQKENDKLKKEREVLERKKEEFEEFRKVTPVSKVSELEPRLVNLV